MASSSAISSGKRDRRQNRPLPLFELCLESMCNCAECIRLARFSVIHSSDGATALQRWARPLVAERALVHRAARRLGHPASIPRAIMSRSPEALALGPAVISFRRRYHCPSFGCLLNRSRDCTRSRVPPLSRRRYADPPAGASFCCLRFASALFGTSPRPLCRLR
jgi:hypothetical protein